MKHIILSSCLVLIAFNTSAKDVWECGNAVLQDLCQNSKCNGKNPPSMDKLTISVSGQKNISICTHQACWRGEATISNQNTQPILRINNIRWQDRDDPQSHKNYVLSINRSTQRIYFDGQNETHPVACRAV